MKEKKTILIRYGEIALKSAPVRRRFEKILMKNIKLALKGMDFKICVGFGRIFLEAEETKKTTSLLKRVFGIVSFSPCKVTSSELENIKALSLQTAKNWSKTTTFAIKARRVGSHKFTSQEVKEKIGEEIVKLGFRVNLSKPKKTLFIEIRDNKAYIYTEKISGLGGLPIGTQGRVLALIEGKKGLAASWLMMKRGCWVVPVFKNIAEKRMKECLDFFKKWSFTQPRYYEFQDKKDFLNNVAKKEKAQGIVLADTLKHMNQFQKQKKEFHVPVYRPVVGMDSSEIKNLTLILSHE